MAGKVYLITGANRGIGRGLFDHYVRQPNHTIVAAVRSPSAAQGLLRVPRGQGTTVVLVKLDAASTTDPFDAVQALQGQIDHIDVVISAAGIAKLNTIEALPLDEYMEMLQVNGIAVLLLAQATLPLLKKAPQPARFVFISAAAGSVTDMSKYPYPNIGYCSSKALANTVTVKLGMEHDWLVALCIHPGLVQTDMGNAGARAFGLDEAPLTLEESSENTATIIERATKQEHSGKFFNETIDKIHPW